jgi:membrane associated rhomboid family serine protease
VPERFMAELREHWIGPEWRTIGAAMFLHDGWLHVVANMWMLLIFGDNVEDRLGHARYLLFYLLCGAVAAGAHIGFDPHSAVPTIGASGAIAGVMGGYLIAFPTARVVTIVPLFILPWRMEVPAFVFLGVWIATQLFSGMSPRFQEAGAGGIAWWAHIGGFAAGLILMPLLARRRPRAPGQT